MRFNKESHKLVEICCLLGQINQLSEEAVPGFDNFASVAKGSPISGKRSLFFVGFCPHHLVTNSINLANFLACSLISNAGEFISITRKINVVVTSLLTLEFLYLHKPPTLS